jgi:hypothetical protein
LGWLPDLIEKGNRVVDERRETIQREGGLKLLKPRREGCQGKIACSFYAGTVSPSPRRAHDAPIGKDSRFMLSLLLFLRVLRG